MDGEVYQKLRDKLNQYSVGFATTASGVEMKILVKLFTEEEAEMYLNLAEDLHTGKEIAEKINGNPGEVEALLRRMTEKGQTFTKPPGKEGEPYYYAAAPFVHGILEHQIKRMDPELAGLLEEFFIAGPITRLVPSLRTIPVNTAVRQDLYVAPYDDVKSIIRNKDRIALTVCICYVWQQNRGQACEQPSEVCMLFDFYGEYYVDRDMGRWISRDEALAKLEECEKAGLVAQLSNSENPEALCNCCPNCCGTLRGLKRLSIPAGLLVPTNYFSQINSELCTACEACIDRCPMDAITMNRADTAEINPERCIGCGLCVSICPVEAFSLIRKQKEKLIVPPSRGIFMRPSQEFEDSIQS